MEITIQLGSLSAAEVLFLCPHQLQCRCSATDLDL